jgi:DNA ligase-1
MSSPAKRRKLDSNNKSAAAPARGLEYFFSKQRSRTVSSPASEPGAGTASLEQTDEELARKLQAEFDTEALRPPPSAHGTSGKSSSTPPDVPGDVSSPENNVPGDGEKAKSPPRLGGTTLRLESSGAVEDTISSSIPLDESPFTFETSKYVAALQQSWSSQGGGATYALLTRCFTLVNSTQSRIKIVDTLVNCLRLLIEGDPSSLKPAV